MLKVIVKIVVCLLFLTVLLPFYLIGVTYTLTKDSFTEGAQHGDALALKLVNWLGEDQ